MIKRLLLLLGPLAALIGTLGLVLFGRALIGVFEVLTLSITETSLPALAEFQWAVVSAVIMVVGVVISIISVVIQYSRQTLSMLGKILYTVAGVTLLVGAVSLAMSIIEAKGSFKFIANPSNSPAPESISDMIQSVEPTMTFGYSLLGLSAAISLLAGLIGSRTSFSQANLPPATLSVVFVTIPGMVSTLLVLLIASVRLNGNSLEAIISDVSANPKPAELAEH
ncbi:MAG: hypothetical protein L7U72_03940, partial [Rubripirellula sp.]|nr:hypothetical protein [Rubripirellula sp.]